MTTVESIYDFESALEEAFRAALASQGLKAYTITTAPDANGDPAGQPSEEFQKYRPRCETMFATGAGLGRLLAESGQRVASGQLREQAYSGELSVKLVTAADIQIHRAYRAAVRYAMDTICRTVNGASLVNLKVQRVQAAGTGDTYEPQKGSYVSVIRYHVDFSIQSTVWADLTAAT